MSSARLRAALYQSSLMKNRTTAILMICLFAALIIAPAIWAQFNSAPKRLMAAASRVEAALLQAPLSKAAGGVYDTTDRYLEDLQVPFPSEKLLNVFADVPTEDAMIFITSGNDAQTELVYRSISYLGWPRQIGEVRCGTDGSAELWFQPRAERPIKWLFFHRIAPPADFTPRSKTIGQRLTIVPVSELKEWKLYCSR